MAKDTRLRSALALALASKNKGMFEAALNALESALTPDEVRERLESPLTYVPRERGREREGETDGERERKTGRERESPENRASSWLSGHCT